MSNQEDGFLLEFKYFLILDGIIVLGILIWLFRRPRRSQMRLKMSGGKKPQASLSGQKSSPLQRKDNFSSVENLSENDSQRGERVLTVRFNYNGHSFEAFEALGLPPGSSVRAAEEAYKNFTVTSQESREFLTAAVEAIRQSSR